MNYNLLASIIELLLLSEVQSGQKSAKKSKFVWENQRLQRESASTRCNLSSTILQRNALRYVARLIKISSIYKARFGLHAQIHGNTPPKVGTFGVKTLLTNHFLEVGVQYTIYRTPYPYIMHTYRY